MVIFSLGIVFLPLKRRVRAPLKRGLREEDAGFERFHNFFLLKALMVCNTSSL